MVANAAAASLGAMQTNAALRRGSFVPSVRGVASLAPPRRLTRARFPVVRAAQGPAESNEDYEARLHAEATAAVERRILKVVPADLLGSIAIPQKLVEIRSYVRWEEAGKPEDTSREWQAREYQAALIDLKLEMLAGGNLNDVRRRYQLDTEFGEDSPMHSPSKEELEMLKKALAISKEPEYYSDEKAQEEIDAEATALAARVAAASVISAPGPAMPPPPVAAAAAAAAAAPAPGDAKKAEKLRLKAEAEAQMKKLQEQMKALEEEEEEEEEEDAELAKRVAAAATAVVPPPPPVPAPPAPAPAAQSSEAAPVFKPAGAAPAAPDTSKARALSAAKAAAEAELKAAEAEMRAAQAALKAAAAKREADAKKSATVLGDELRMGHVPADVAKSTYGVKAKAADLEAKAKAKKDAQKKVDALFIEPGVENPTQIKAEAKRLIEMELAKEEEILAAKRSTEPAKPVAVTPTPPAPPVPRSPTAASIKSDIPELVDEVAGEVANIEDFQPKFVTGAAVDERLAKIEALHAAQLKAIKKEHEEELLKAKLSVETDGASSSAEKQLRAKLGELVRALEVSNKQCKGLKEKLAATSEELATEKKISGKAGEVLAAHKTNEMMIKTLKKELSVALEVQATAEKRAQAAEKEAAAAKVDMDVNTGKSESLEERVKELEAELSEAQEVIAEFKASWEADRKVIAVLSKMKDAPEAQAKIAAAAAEESSSSSVFSKWAAGVTRVLVGEPAADRDVAAEKLKASAIKWSPKYDAIEAEKAKADKAKPYARQGGSATIAMLRARKETAERAVDENARARQANWLEAAEQATEAAAAFEEEKEEEEEPEPVKAPAPVKSNAVPAVPKARKIPLPGDKLPPAAPAKATAPSVPPPGANAVVKTAEDAVDIQKPPTATGKAAAPVAMPKPTAMPKFIPAASKAADDKKGPGGWSSSHLPPTR